MQAMGGRERLEALKAIELDVRETTFRVNDSERATPPYWAEARKIVETRDLVGGRYKLDETYETPQFSWTRSAISDGKMLASKLTLRNQSVWNARPALPEHLALAPERVLLTAAEAPDLHLGPDQRVHGVLHHALVFTWRGFPVTILIDADTHLPDQVLSVRTDPYDVAQTAWGDVSWRMEFLYWKREPDGLVYPHQWTTFRNGEPVAVDIAVQVKFAPVVDAATFLVPKEGMDAFESSGKLALADRTIDESKAFSEIAPNVWMIAGRWNVLVVMQPDGLLIIECPESATYTERLTEALSHRFPSVPIKAVVTTTDATWHYAGLRTFVARGTPIYALDLNAELLQRFVSAPHTLEPDTLAKTPRAMHLHAVSDRTTIGSGPTRIELYPIRGQGDERMMMAYFPALKLLYGSSNDLSSSSDAAGRQRGTFNLFELAESVKVRGLQVDNFAAIHTPITPWAKVVLAAYSLPAIE
jgi:hypothetical protein